MVLRNPHLFSVLKSPHFSLEIELIGVTLPLGVRVRVRVRVRV